MATIGRKNVHGKGGVRFKAGYTSDKMKNMLRNVVSQLIISGQIEVTLEVAKRAQKKAERMVTFAKKGDLAARRQAARFVREEEKRKIYAIAPLGEEVLELEMHRIERLYRNMMEARQ